jgi:hypothetical protein
MIDRVITGQVTAVQGTKSRPIKQNIEEKPVQLPMEEESEKDIELWRILLGGT